MSEPSWFKKKYRKIQEEWNKNDLYRDTPVRYIGYANEVGEAFRTWVPQPVVTFSYVLSSSYVISDAFDKGQRAHAFHWSSDVTTRQKKVALTVFDVLIWQGFASVILPGLTINRVCAFSSKVLIKFKKMPNKTARVWSTIIGLAVLPFIVKPIDTAVEIGMNATIRKYYSAPI